MVNIRINSINTQFQNRVNQSPTGLFPILFATICILFWLNIYQPYQNDYRPQGVHFWAQADRYSVALNYYDNGLNFFKPQTNYLEFSEGATGIEFPAIQYISAVTTKVFSSRDNLYFIYRNICYIVLCIGLYFLSKTIKINGGNGFQQLLIPFFFLLSPVLLFYGFNLLPDIPGLALVLISYYYFEKYRLRLNFNAIYAAMAWGFGAALLKLTCAIFPVAWVTWFLVDALFISKTITRNQILKVVGVFLLSAFICGAISYYFTVRANAVYKSSVFLSMSRHINQWTDFSDIWENVVCWHREYFRETQYWIMLVALLATLNFKRHKEFLIIKGILLLGMCGFVLLMGKQLMHHDYYAICTIIPVALIWSLDGLMLLTSGCFGSLALLYIVLNTAPKSFEQADKRRAEIYKLPCREIWDYKTYMIEAHDWIDAHKIPQSARFFVLYDFPLNTPLIYLDRKGMVLDHFKMKDKNLVELWFNTLHPQYVVIPNQWESKWPEDQPQIAQQYTLVYRGKSVLIFKK